MKVLIAYASKTGTTEKCAKILKAIVDDSTLCDLTKEKPDLDEYGCIVVGGSIRRGQLHRDAKRFIEKNQDVLKKKRCGYFICNCLKTSVDEYFENNIPLGLLEKAVAVSSFGGEINQDDYTGLDKIIVRAMEEQVYAPDKVRLSTSSEAIQKFAEKIRKRA